jgi:hypothetical protein
MPLRFVAGDKEELFDGIALGEKEVFKDPSDDSVKKATQEQCS